jgi:hypothetical protein
MQRHAAKTRNTARRARAAASIARRYQAVNEPDVGSPASSWNGLYKIAGVATLVMVGLFLFDLIAWIAVGPNPSTAEGWFTLLQNDRPRGLLLLSIPTLFGMMLYLVTFLALYETLRAVNHAYAALAALAAFVGLAIALVTHMAYPMVHLSGQYAHAATAAQRTLYLAAGEARIATTVTGANLGGFLVEGAALVFSLLMLRSTAFGKVAACLGILGHGLDLARTAMNLASVPENISAVLLMVGGLPQVVWLVLVGWGLFQLGQGQPGVVR